MKDFYRTASFETDRNASAERGKEPLWKKGIIAASYGDFGAPLRRIVLAIEKELELINKEYKEQYYEPFIKETKNTFPYKPFEIRTIQFTLQKQNPIDKFPE